ncbi:MAG: hypothetical protein M0D55_17585 [Elusimicrobiota bacterium]|nr:MAG: hypothetical protein M0D55_17585 [Elusimicrobiota bacterium]
MRGALGLLLLLAACGSPPKQAEFPQPLPPPPPVAVVAEVVDPNFELVVVESVPNADDEGVSFTKVLVDGKELGKTAVGPRSQEKRVRLKLEAGNQPVKLEHWFLPPVGEWTRLPDALQPRERFVRVDAASIARLTLRYGPNGAPALTLTREAVSR